MIRTPPPHASLVVQAPRQRHADLRSEPGSRYQGGEGQGDMGRAPCMALLCQIPGMQGGALPPFHSSSCGFRCRRWYSKGPLDHLHAGLLRHLTPRGSPCGLGNSKGMQSGLVINQRLSFQREKRADPETPRCTGQRMLRHQRPLDKPGELQG